jgi:hypothetical protein
VAEYVVKSGDGERGPLSSSQLRSEAVSGKISRSDLIRKLPDGNWFRAATAKGLWPEGHEPSADTEPSETDPLVAAAGKALGVTTDAASKATAAIGGAVTGWLKRREEKKAEIVKAPAAPPSASSQGTQTWVDALTRDNQSPDVVTNVSEKVHGILMSDERLTYVAVQNKPIVNWMPDCIALTNKRFIFFRPKILGRVDFEDYVWRELHDAQLSENIVGSTFTITTAAGRKLSLDYLPKSQARAVYRIAQEMEEHSLAERRDRSLEEKRAAAGNVVVQTNLGVQTPTTQPITISHEDPMQKLQQLKSMVDAGLISAAEYDAKKADILSRM